MGDGRCSAAHVGDVGDQLGDVGLRRQIMLSQACSSSGQDVCLKQSRGGVQQVRSTRIPQHPSHAFQCASQLRGMGNKGRSLALITALAEETPAHLYFGLVLPLRLPVVGEYAAISRGCEH